MSKNWFITGTSAGFGRVLTERLLARGDRVFATIRRDGALDDLCVRHGERLVVLKLDMTDAAAVAATIDATFARAGRIDAIVSNAGYGLFGAAEEVSDTQLERQLATNLTGAIRLIKSALPHLRRQGGGRIVQLSSEGGQIAYPAFSLYHASKWGIEGFIEAVAQEVASFGIDFVLVEPGPTGTQFGMNLDLGRPLPCYDATPAGDMWRALKENTFDLRGDLQRSVDAMLPFLDMANPPLRLPLGSLAFEHIRAALRERLVALEALEAVARAADKLP
ncbi:SDR family oxidoreductase [Chitinasiproducens palmae]|uniref:Short-chain dehydrogenase n=1 Tax=Chitinasiproducens palmae TaxID=1770053 RepID=A0A1H2PK32_9BURK|nr:SDR family oxidoreductase [Chitinasiproducens palmae]SDV46701.1 Short-chain dehydrogenase [Chitinasiproducens palmae]